MKKKIENHSDIELLVDRFYERVKEDSQIGFFFTDVVKVQWEKHLPVMYTFWENTIFFTGEYVGNPMATHIQLHQTMPLSEDHFNQWNRLFSETVDELFEGDKAELAKQRGKSISAVILIKIASTG